MGKPGMGVRSDFAAPARHVPVGSGGASDAGGDTTMVAHPTPVMRARLMSATAQALMRPALEWRAWRTIPKLCPRVNAKRLARELFRRRRGTPGGEHDAGVHASAGMVRLSRASDKPRTGQLEPVANR